MTPRKKTSPRTNRRARSGPTRRSRRRVALAASLVVGAALAGLASAAFWASRPGPGSGQRVAIEWPAGASASSAGAVLARAGLVESPRLFAAYLWLVGGASQLQPGTHLLNDALSPRQLVQRLARLPGRPAVKVRLPEGLNHLQVAERLEAAQICSARSFLRVVTDPGLLTELGVRGPTLEGYLFPATYELLPDTPAAVVARQLVREMRRRLQKLHQRRPGAAERLEREHGWGEREILTLASIVEREAADPTERKTIAGVFYNRLRDPEFRPKGTLQSDPTAGYGCLVGAGAAPSCRGYAGKITPAMLRDAANPYNTYRHPGLPPGPIANPGEGAIDAVLDPLRTDYLFFFATRDRRHTFSRSFDEHRAVVRSNGGKPAPDAAP